MLLHFYRLLGFLCKVEVLIVPNMFCLCFELGEKLFKRRTVEEICIFQYMHDDCGFVFVFDVVLHDLAVFQLLKRLAVGMMKDKYIARFCILFEEEILLFIGLTL